MHGIERALALCLLLGACGSGAETSATMPAVAPTLRTQPQDVYADVGQPATFSVEASGSEPLRYQWRRSQVDIAGATSRTYTIPTVGPGDYRVSFDVVVSNAAGSVTSGLALLTVDLPPTIVSPPEDASSGVGLVATFIVTATGVTPFSYQWLRNGVAIPAATGRSYATPPLTQADSGAKFSVTVTNRLGSVTSREATITLYPPPVITTQPSDVAVTAGSGPTFTVAASGQGPLTYQWRLNGVAIRGATSSTITFAPVDTSDNGSILSVVVTGVGGSVTSRDATLTVTPRAP
jgi:hypothetical protein